MAKVMNFQEAQHALSQGNTIRRLGWHEARILQFNGPVRSEDDFSRRFKELFLETRDQLAWDWVALRTYDVRIVLDTHGLFSLKYKNHDGFNFTFIDQALTIPTNTPWEIIRVDLLSLLTMYGPGNQNDAEQSRLARDFLDQLVLFLTDMGERGTYYTFVYSPSGHGSVDYYYGSRVPYCQITFKAK